MRSSALESKVIIKEAVDCHRNLICTCLFGNSYLYGIYRSTLFSRSDMTRTIIGRQIIRCENGRIDQRSGQFSSYSAFCIISGYKLNMFRVEPSSSSGRVINIYNIIYSKIVKQRNIPQSMLSVISVVILSRYLLSSRQ